MKTERLSLRERLARDGEIVLRAKQGHPRRYDVTVLEPGEWEGEPQFECTTRMRMRHFIASFFRKHFSSRAINIWVGWHGAGGEDGLGNRIVVEQVNNFSRYPERRGLLLPEKCGVAA